MLAKFKVLSISGNRAGHFAWLIIGEDTMRRSNILTILTVASILAVGLTQNAHAARHQGPRVASSSTLLGEIGIFARHQGPRLMASNGLAPAFQNDFIENAAGNGVR